MSFVVVAFIPKDDGPSYWNLHFVFLFLIRLENFYSVGPPCFTCAHQCLKVLILLLNNFVTWVLNVWRAGPLSAVVSWRRSPIILLVKLAYSGPSLFLSGGTHPYSTIMLRHSCNSCTGVNISDGICMHQNSLGTMYKRTIVTLFAVSGCLYNLNDKSLARSLIQPDFRLPPRIHTHTEIAVGKLGLLVSCWSKNNWRY